MKSKIKHLISIFIALAIILSSFKICTIESKALSIHYRMDSSKKNIELGIKPYGGLTVREVIGGYVSYNSNYSYQPYLYDGDKRLESFDIVEGGKTYRFEATIRSYKVYGSNFDPKMDKYSVKLINLSETDDKSYYKNVKTTRESDYKIIFTCDFTMKTNSDFDMGYYCLDISEEPFYPQGNSMDYLPFTNFLSKIHDEKQIDRIETSTYDLNKDGIKDIRTYKERTSTQPGKIMFYKHDDCALHGAYYFEMSQEDSDKLSSTGEFHYSKMAIIFDIIDISKCDISGINDVEWTGSPFTPEPVVTYAGYTLLPGKNYEVKYANNKDVGTASVTITGLLGYEGTVTKEFKINKPKEPETEQKKENQDKNQNGVPVLNGTVTGTLDTGLSVTLPDGTKVKNQWGIVNGKKYYFDARGYAAANEYANGKWFGADGTLDENYTMVWKSNETGWWIEDKSGWYPVSRWLKIDGYWYYFLDSGYMDYSEYRDGCWLGSDGAWVEEYYGGTWKSDGKGWWYEDSAGWYPQSQYLWIDGVNYYFGADGYMQ